MGENNSQTDKQAFSARELLLFACREGRASDAGEILSGMPSEEARILSLEELDAAAIVSGSEVVRELLRFCAGDPDCGFALRKAVSDLSVYSSEGMAIAAPNFPRSDLIKSIKMLAAASPAGIGSSGAFSLAGHMGELDIFAIFIAREDFAPARGEALRSAAGEGNEECVTALLASGGISRESKGQAQCLALEMEEFEGRSPQASRLLAGSMEDLDADELALVKEWCDNKGYNIGARWARALLEGKELEASQHASASRCKAGARRI